MENEKYEGTWGVVRSSAGEVIGKFTKFTNKNQVLEAWKAGTPIQMGPVWEFQSGMVQTQTGVQVMGQAAPYGICMKEISIYVNPVSVLFFSDMSSRDRRLYIEAIEKVVDYQEKSTAADAGIILSSVMPKSMQ